MKMPKAFVNGINIHYVQTGKGPNLVLIHGVASNLGQWQLGILPTLVKDFRLTMYDLRGHGYSDMPAKGYTPDHMVGDFTALMDNLGMERASILGHSYGGVVALYYAVLHPERVDKLIIADTGVPCLEPGRGRDALLMRWRGILRGEGIEVPDEKADDVAYLMEQMLKRRQRSWSGMGVRRTLARLSRLSNATTFGQEYRDTSGLTLEMIGQIHAPVLLVYGDRSPLTASFQALHTHLPNNKAVIIADGGHFFPLEHPDAFVTHVKTFLEAENGRPSWPIDR
jgi:pimeloyl-ACP methyl ester carboxylesterase